MEVKTFDYLGKKFGVMKLQSDIWNCNFHPLLISLYNRYNLLNKRNVISKTKNKSEVSGGGRKPWRQKGTGRARQGSIRSPQWKGGGVVFGPDGKQNYSVQMNRKEKRKALSSILSKKLSLGEIIVAENINFDSYKTKEAYSFVKSLESKKNLLIVNSLLESKNEKFEKSFRNIKEVSLKNSVRLDVYDVIKSNIIVFTPSSLTEIEKRLSGFDNNK